MSVTSLIKIRSSLNTLCLALTFHVSLGVSARKTAFILNHVFGLRISYQTVLNYSQHAAYYCHKFNLHHKGPADNIQAGDETYIKIAGKHAYTFFFISSESRAITAYHIDSSRSTLPATIAMNEAIRTVENNQDITFVTDGNPSYPAGIHFLNMSQNNSICLRKVIGLQNLDSESEQFRPYKQLIERLNRTYKAHVRSACGFNSKNGAMALTTLFVTHYNFIRPHSSLKFKPPVPLEILNNSPTIQAKWAQIMQSSMSLAA
jgi:putative transposase